MLSEETWRVLDEASESGSVPVDVAETTEVVCWVPEGPWQAERAALIARAPGLAAEVAEQRARFVRACGQVGANLGRAQNAEAEVERLKAAVATLAGACREACEKLEGQAFEIQRHDHHSIANRGAWANCILRDALAAAEPRPAGDATAAVGGGA